MIQSRGTRLAVLLISMLALAQTKPAPAPAAEPQIPTISAAPTAQIVPPPPNYHYPLGQTYVYTVEWHLFTAGTAKVSLNANGKENQVTATAESAGFVNSLYKVHDRFDAYFDPKTFCSSRVTKHTEEGNHARDTHVLFDYARRKSVLDEKNLKTGETKHVENDIPSCVSDVVSGFYYLSSMPLQVGNTNIFLVTDGGKVAEVTAHVEGREQVKVPSGTYQTVRVRAESTSGTLKGKGTVWAWFTDDANHTPVQMRSKLGWGTLLFRLQRIEK